MRLSPDAGLLPAEAAPNPELPERRRALRLRLDRLMLEAADLAQAAPRVLQALGEATGARCAACWADNAQGGRELVATWAPADAGLDAGLDDFLHTLAAGNGDTTAPQRPAELRSSWSGPLVGIDGPVGVLELFGLAASDLDAAWFDELRDLGCQLGRLHLRALAQARLRESERHLADTIELAAIGITHVDGAGRFIHANRWVCELLGYTRDELLDLTVQQVSHPDDLHVADAQRAQLRAGAIDAFQVEKRYLRKDGTPVWVQLTISVLRDAQGRPQHDIAVFQDISARKAAQQAQQRSEQRFRSLVEMSSDWYWELDTALRFTMVGGRRRGGEFERLLCGRQPWEALGGEGDGEGWQQLREAMERRQPIRDFEYAMTDRRGRRRHVSVSGSPLFDADGGFAGYRGVSRDISERKLAEERIRYLATHDSLTGLPNRAMFGELLGHVLQQSHRHQRRFAVLFIDLDRFKLINDTLGHEAGDTLLCETARRLTAALRSSDIVARLGGDEFVVLLPDLQGAEQAARVARKLLSAVIRPLLLCGQDCRVTASVGISVYPDDAGDESALLAHADVAMYHAKEAGKNNFQFYDGSLEARSLERLALESRLRHALQRRELSLHYQAKVALASNQLTGVEALLRWNSADLGSVSPAQFIPLAEETGLILPIGRWVLRAACEQAVAWQREGLPPVPVAVNLSPRQLVDPELVSTVQSVLAATGLAPALLELEVTESSVMHDMDRALAVLQRLKRMGVRLAIDDFGTGYSSLAQLKRFPIDTLKVDRSFIRELPADVEDCAIADAVIAMGHALNLTVVAEGVETAAQQQFLRERACDQMQGYLFSKPLPAAEFARLVRAHRA